MSSEIIGLVGIAVFVCLIMLRVPVGLALLLVGLIGYSVLQSLQVALIQLGMSTFAFARSYTLSVIPFFTVMGSLLANAGLSNDLYRAVDRWVGRIPGSLATTTIGAAAVFSSISGSAMSCTATLARVSLPEMRRFRYDPALAGATVAVGGTLGILIPPSVSLILYGVLTQEPIGPLFIAGIVPGTLLMAAFMLVIYLLARFRPDVAPVATVESVSLAEKFRSLTAIWPFILLFLLSIGGIYAGFFTPTEAGAVGAFGALVFTLVSRRLDWKGFLASFDEAARTTGMIFVVLIGANLFGNFLAISRLPMSASLYVGSLDVSPYAVLAIILLVYLILGAFMESIAIQVLTLPIVHPIIVQAGFDSTWFSIIFVLMMCIALITPPLGMCCYIVHGIDRSIPLQTVFRGISPFLLTMIGVTLLLIIFPDIVLFLPRLMR